MPLPFPRSLVPALAFTLLGAGAGAEERPVLGLPIDCRPGVDCVVQNYVDHDGGPGWRDHRCGHMSYDGHDGIDFRIPSMEAMRRGVVVRAAAAGTVSGMRDGMTDTGLAGGREANAGKECGNGVVIAHAGGWSTQYCHMAQGSITVRPGASVARGAVLGRVGLSGLTAFPHLHLAVRHDGRIVDPFAPDRPSDACDTASGPTLWAAEVAAKLAYVSPFVLNAGFAGENIEAARLDDFGLPPPTFFPELPALVAVVRAIGLEAGDEMVLELVDPSGKVVARNAPPPLDRAKAQWMLKSGLRRPATGWPAGTWRADYRVVRNGARVVEKTFTIDRRPD